MDDIFEGIKAFPGGLRRLTFRLRRIGRWSDQLHRRDIARTIRKDRAGFHPHDELRANRFTKQRISVAHARSAVDPQSFWLVVHGDEKQSDVRIDEQIAEALEHAITVKIR